MSDSSILNLDDCGTAQDNWKSIAPGSKLFNLRCRKPPFSHGVISAFKGRNWFHHCVREQLARFLKEFGHAPLISKLEIKRVIVECEVVGKLIYGSGNVSLI
jgi:hypothetical protein